MKPLKQFYLVVLSFAMILQLTGCGSSQTVSSETGTPRDAVAASSAAEPAPSSTQSSTPTQSDGELPVKVQPESVLELSQSQAQPSSSLVQSAASTEPPAASEPPASTSLLEETNMNQITIEAGGKTFSATLANNEAAKAFTAHLPLTVQMGDLNGQEKFYGLPDNLPDDSTERPSIIHSGDIFCWSGNTLVLFYATFQNSYGGYVRLGAVDDPTGLAVALGSGTAEVTWVLTK